MANVDFTRTPEQLKTQIFDDIDTLSRHLTASQGHGERGTSALLNVVLVLSVLVGQFLFGIWFEPAPGKKPAAGTEMTSSTFDRDKRIIETLLGRVDENADSILAAKARVAPNLQIDGKISAIKASVNDTRNLLGLSPTPSSDRPSHSTPITDPPKQN